MTFRGVTTTCAPFEHVVDPGVLHTSFVAYSSIGELVRRLRTRVIPTLSYLIVLRTCNPT
jgi:hypothetical protein